MGTDYLTLEGPIELNKDEVSLARTCFFSNEFNLYMPSDQVINLGLPKSVTWLPQENVLEDSKGLCIGKSNLKYRIANRDANLKNIGCLSLLPWYKESTCITWISARIVTLPYRRRKSSGIRTVVASPDCESVIGRRASHFPTAGL